MNHAQKAARFIEDLQKTDWHDQALWYVRDKRDLAAGSVPEWEQLRRHAEQIKAHTLSKLEEYLKQTEKQALKNGTIVHWAKDALEHNQIVFKILKEANASQLVKSKSMLTEERQLNPYLEQRGIEVIDTDLGERIVQLRHEPPSHIVLPAIHLKKEEVGELFQEKLGTEKGKHDPTYLTKATRLHLREKFLFAEAGLTGVNFGIAETGGFVVCTNEGNADLGTSIPPLHIACMGIEKIIPKFEHLGVFTRLLARSATGQVITTYTSHYHGPSEGKIQHLIIVDNGRSQFLGKIRYQKALSCVRCGACMNTGPVYREVGVTAMDTRFLGLLVPRYHRKKTTRKLNSLPYACTLCASCRDICPVKVNLDSQLYERRQDIVAAGVFPKRKRVAIKLLSKILQSPGLLNMTGKMYRVLIFRLPKFLLYSSLNTWGKQRDLPIPPKMSFQDWYLQNRKNRK